MEENNKKTKNEEVDVTIVRKCADCGQILSENAYDCWNCSSTNIIDAAEEVTPELEEETLKAQVDRLENEFKKYKLVSFIMIGAFSLLLLLYIIK